jgi:hypothetical protein
MGEEVGRVVAPPVKEEKVSEISVYYFPFNAE